MSLTAIPMHLVGEVAFGCYDTNEMLYARQRVPRIPDHSLTVFDNGFLSLPDRYSPILPFEISPV